MTCLKQLADKESTEIIVSLNKMQVDYLVRTDNNWQVALDCYLGSIDNHYPSYSPLRFFLKIPHGCCLKLHLNIL